MRRAFVSAAVALVAFAGVALPQIAFARFTVTPTKITVERKPSGTASGTFDVVLAKERRDFEVEIEDIVQQPDGTLAFVSPSESPFSASSWVSVTPSRFSGNPDRTQPVQFTVRVPPKAEPGDHVTSLTVTQVPSKSGEVAQAVQAISVRLTVRVFGKARPEVRIVSLDAPSISGGSPLEVDTVLENTGNISLDFEKDNPSSLAVVQGDEEKAASAFTGELFPGQSREFQLSWNEAPLFGQFQAVVSVDAGKEVVTDSKSVLQLPWRQAGALILVALAAVILAAGRRRGHF